MTAVDFFWDPVCPWAWLTSRWVHEVIPLRDLKVDWRFISLAIVNEDRHDDTEFAADYRKGLNRGLELLRVAAAARKAHGAEAIGPLYTAFGSGLHTEGRAQDFDGPDRAGTVAALEVAGLPVSLVEAATDPSWDRDIREDTERALARTGKGVGTPIITFGAPDGPSFFGPVISRVPVGQEAARLWDAIGVLAHQPGFAELKRSLRERPQLQAVAGAASAGQQP